ncbi:peptide-methionine (S)-S-oxide reductase MsrA [Pontibacter silvestris]|uniref:peptide-methionine (S)-S-oxide reductase n=1 Tax=Pontibacter silvestris TaxID=2305183 RepID=A0ABW4X0P0_9BACT|nr:peptide-methionine (S)-S-oxide reductase [Pontibacter silvestris]MCC9135690.1 peptide-methionine (S)-S-oxide reductase [Pontibacter silvestris]
MTKAADTHKPLIEQSIPKDLETATFAMGCFWRPDALFGSIEGVVRTRVGYTGGTTENPTYWMLADHIETVQIDYDPAVTEYRALLNIFFSSHKATQEAWKRQYMSAVFFHNREQEGLVYQAKKNLEAQSGSKVYTTIYPYRQFYLAEDRHQKYKLQRRLTLMREFRSMYPDMMSFINSTAAARVNGYLYGYGNRERLQQEINSFGLSATAQDMLLDKLEVPRVINCGS